MTNRGRGARASRHAEATECGDGLRTPWIEADGPISRAQPSLRTSSRQEERQQTDSFGGGGAGVAALQYGEFWW